MGWKCTIKIIMTNIENAFSTALCVNPFKVTVALKLVQRTSPSAPHKLTMLTKHNGFKILSILSSIPHIYLLYTALPVEVDITFVELTFSWKHHSMVVCSTQIKLRVSFPDSNLDIKYLSTMWYVFFLPRVVSQDPSCTLVIAPMTISSL